MLLSICVPTYNRASELKRLLASIPDVAEIEVVVVDDGSVDNTRSVLADAVASRNTVIRSYTQENSGRAISLQKALASASARYSMVMDSDDWFIDGWWPIVRAALLGGNDSFVFGTHLLRNGKIRINVPKQRVCSLLALRADYRQKGDLKEIVRTDILKSCLYDYPKTVRRVPTSIIWARVSECCFSSVIPFAIAVKEYLPGGMTARGRQLRMENALPMLDLNFIIVNSKSYQSLLFRIKSALQWARYAQHINDVRPKNIWQYFVWPAGWLMCRYDLFRLRHS